MNQQHMSTSVKCTNLAGNSFLLTFEKKKEEIDEAFWFGGLSLYVEWHVPVILRCMETHLFIAILFFVDELVLLIQDGQLYS